MDRMTVSSPPTSSSPAEPPATPPAGAGGRPPVSPERAYWERQPYRPLATADGRSASESATPMAAGDSDLLGKAGSIAKGWAKEAWVSTTARSTAPTAARGASFADDIIPTSPRLTSGFDLMWARLRELPGITSWKILNDSLFLSLSFVIGLSWFIIGTTMTALGVGLLLVWVGAPILAALFAIAIWTAQLERSRIKVFMGMEIPSPYQYFPREGKPWKRAWGFVRNRQLWRDIAYLFLLFPVGCAELIVVALPVQFFVAPLVVLAGGSSDIYGVTVDSFFGSILGLGVGVVFLLPWSMLVNFVALMHVEFGKWLLAPSVQERLTERVEELTESRNAVMRAMHLERRRIERDLHDGAQQRLVNLAMELGLAREKMNTDVEAARKLLEESHEDAKLVLTELRELVRGIHPAVLTDRGLDAAISAIAGRSPIPVGVDIDLPGRELEEVEGTAYFVVVEALTNIAKHSGATEANVSIRKVGNWLRIVVSDNGKGGADLTAGTGLRGLEDRIAALDGHFAIESPKGVGTSIMVVIPCG
ncbi:MAG: sensor histidine kinase [Thermomicrobiales bacterium]